MNDPKVNVFFLSEKFSKVRWVPEELNESERFLTGSWDMPANYLRIWRLKRNQYVDDYNDYAPFCSDKVAFSGDVTGIEFVNENYIAASCTDGRVTLIQLHRAVEEDKLEQVARSQVLHKFAASGRTAPCTDISVHDKEIATVGENGQLNIIDAQTVQCLRRSIEASSCALTAVAFVNSQEVLVANRMGIINVFDVRVSAETPLAATFMISCQDEKQSNYVSSLASHPTQQHIILAGSEEGSITVWDLRHPGFPASYLSAHNSAITEIGFHRSDPTKVLTASEGGELWQWTQYPTLDGTNTYGMDKNKTDNSTPWLNGERAKNRINVTSLITDLQKPINSFDARGSKIICGTDNEAVYFINNIF